MVRTPGFHPGNRGSIPLEATRKKLFGFSVKIWLAARNAAQCFFGELSPFFNSPHTTCPPVRRRFASRAILKILYRIFWYSNSHMNESSFQGDRRDTSSLDIWLATEFRAEHDRQYRILNKLGLLDILPESGEMGIIGLDNQEYPIPPSNFVQKKFALGCKVIPRLNNLLLFGCLWWTHSSRH